MKKVVIAPDSFKGTLSSAEVCEIIGQAVFKVLPKTKTVKIPIADGGEGTSEAFLLALGGSKIFVRTKNPLFEDIEAFYALLKDQKTAVIETAAASGLTLVEGRKNALDASTYGTGLLIGDALNRGCKKIILGLGGSATTDGGAGILAALGAGLFDSNRREITPSNCGLEQLCRIEPETLDTRLSGCEIVAACDVDNVLCGPGGAAYVFGPQKGADEDMVKTLDENLLKYAEILLEKTGKNIKDIPGTGAAGGILASLLSFPEHINCKTQSGIELMLNAVNFDDVISDADLVITGEGRFDRQSLEGKAVSGIAKRTKRQNKPLIVISGGTGDYTDEIYKLGISAVFGAVSGIYADFDELKRHCRDDLYKTAENILRLLRFQ
ncbi:MAG: glycerate kinase [Oscillospiraceae bacterium]|nr:glycerate kinase [Oscillospiraceae bacterium]